MTSLRLMVLGIALFCMDLRTAADQPCATKYPILLVHGLGLRDDIKGIEYWGSIPGRLRKEGAMVFLSGHDSLNSHERNAELIRMRLLTVLSQTGCRKVNIIAHSKGGVEARYLISRLGMASNVASLTMISTPNRGAALADIILRSIGPDMAFATGLADLVGKLLGDRSPDSLGSALDLSTNYMKVFNSQVIDSPSVYYQSYACSLKAPVRQPEFVLSWKLIGECQGPNDGVIAVSSAIWGNFRGVLTGSDGVSHTDIINLGRRNARGFDVPAFYIRLVGELKGRGF